MDNQWVGIRKISYNDKNTLRATHTKLLLETVVMARLIACGKVIEEWIGQLAAESPKYHYSEIHGGASTTKR